MSARRTFFAARRRRTTFLLLIPVAALLLVACQDTSGLGGSVKIDGSSTVFPITEAVAEEFTLLNRGVRVTVGVSGTGGGFQRFCRGETDLNDASRPIKPSEIELCADNGVEFVEMAIALDGLTIAVNPENDWVDSLTVEELHRIWRPENPARRWSEVRAGWPDEKIDLFSPGGDSGTFDYFTDVINGESGAQRSDDVTFSEDDNLLVIGVGGERASIAYFGIAFYLNNADRVRAVPIDNGAGPVLPTIETVSSGTYAPLSRPLLLYVNIAALDSPEVAAFVDFYLGEGRQLVDDPEIGYVQLPDALYAVAVERVRTRVTGSVLTDAPAGIPLAELFGLADPP